VVTDKLADRDPIPVHQSAQCPRQGFDHHIVAIIDQLTTYAQGPDNVSLTTARANIQCDRADQRQPSLPPVS